jgi:hypothetical protein
MTATRGWLIVCTAAAIAIAAPASASCVSPQPAPGQETVQSFQPQAVDPLAEGTDPRAVMVGFTWPEAGFCTGQFSVKATETTNQVRIGTVISSLNSNDNCAGIGGAPGETVWVAVTLRAPLGLRAVVRDSDGAVLPLYVFDEHLVRQGPINADIGHYGGVNDNPPLALRKSIHITDPNALRRLGLELSGLQSAPGDAVSCPMDDGSYYLIQLRYSSGSDATIRLQATGCQLLFLGGSTQAAAWGANAPGLFALLADLLGE